MADITDEQIDEAWTFATGGSIVTDDMRAFARAIYALQPSEQEPVTWEWRHLDTTNTPHTWSEWARVEPRNRYTDTVDDRVREYQAYIKQGYRYELRALYASPPPVTAAREQEASATGAEPVQWHVWIDESHFCQRCGCGANSKQAPMPCVATLTTSTTGKALSEEEISKWWASENGLEDHDMCKLNEFREVVRAVEKKLGIGTPKSAEGEGA